MSKKEVVKRDIVPVFRSVPGHDCCECVIGPICCHKKGFECATIIGMDSHLKDCDENGRPLK